MWGTIDAVASYDRILDVYQAVREALEQFAGSGLRLRTHFSHWYEWGSMVYPRFLIPDASGHPDPPGLYRSIWKAGVEAILAAGGGLKAPPRGGPPLPPYG